MGLVKKALKSKKIKEIDLVQYGTIVFGFGLVVAIIASFIDFDQSTSKIIFGTLVLVGIVVGFLNIKNEESIKFLVSSITLVLLAGPFLGLITQNIFQTTVLGKLFGNIIALIVPAAIIVALKEIFLTAKDE